MQQRRCEFPSPFEVGCIDFLERVKYGQVAFVINVCTIRQILIAIIKSHSDVAKRQNIFSKTLAILTIFEDDFMARIMFWFGRKLTRFVVFENQDGHT